MEIAQKYSWWVQKLGELGKEQPNTESHQRYCGHRHKVLGVKLPMRRRLAKEWVRKHTHIATDELTALLDLLARGETHEEKTMVGILLQYLPDQRHELDPEKLVSWLAMFEGWAEIDSLCQSAFTGGDLLDNWGRWRLTLTKFNKHENVNHRRASLVLLVKPVRQSADRRLAKLALKNISELKSEKNILITKAVSWLLRSLTKHHPEKVKEYLRKNETSLPAVARRETWKKLRTGRK